MENRVVAQNMVGDSGDLMITFQAIRVVIRITLADGEKELDQI